MNSYNEPNQKNLPVLLLYNIDPQWPPEDITSSVETTNILADALRHVGHTVTEVCLEHVDLDAVMKPYLPNEHVVFNWCEEIPRILHSGARAAEILETMGFTFTGADSHTLAFSQDKRQVKQVLHLHGINTPKWQVCDTNEPNGWHNFPAIVKPAFEHCSYGITREAVVQTVPGLIQRVRYVLEELKQPALIEDFIDGREFHVGVIGNGVLRVLPPAEIDYSQFDDIHDRLCTYESNFDKTSMAYKYTLPRLPAKLTNDQLSRLEEVAVAAYRATDCRDYARMDIRLRDDTFYILDVNHNADLSPDTSLVLGAELIGLSYGKLGSRLVNLAAQRHPLFSSLYHEKHK